jgi:hypothetical protein
MLTLGWRWFWRRYMANALRRLGSREKLGTGADVASVRDHLRDTKTSIIRWIVSGIIVEAALVFTIARYVH